MAGEFMRGVKTIIERMDEADRIKQTDAWLQQQESLLARVKELEVELTNTVDYRAGEFARLQAQLHQRDTALVAAREALEEVKASAHRGMVISENRLDHALSQIQACEVKR